MNKVHKVLYLLYSLLFTLIVTLLQKKSYNWFLLLLFPNILSHQDGLVLVTL